MFEGLFRSLNFLLIIPIVLLIFGVRKLPEIGEKTGRKYNAI